MAKPEFILQGFTSATHLDALRWLFDLPDVQKVLVSVAFASEGGVHRIEEHLSPHAACITAFVGIRNGATSYQGLVRLHGVAGELYTVDTGRRTLIFHPKLYLVRGRERARLIIGSANLTLAGLHYNIEAGMLLDFDLADASDKAEIDKIETLFASSLKDYPKHVVRVASVADLDQLLEADRLVDERVESSARDALNTDGVDLASEEADIDEDLDDDGAIPRIKLKTRPLRTAGIKQNSNSEEGKPEEISLEESEPIELPSTQIEVENEVELEPEDTTPYVYRSSYQRYRGNEGPRLRAARLKSEAKAKGKKWYFTGLPCKYGHIEDRLVSNGKCRECNRQDSEQSNRLGLYR